MLNCKEATEMVIRQQTEKLGLMERMNLWMHLSMCRLCNLFAIQNAFIDKSVKELDEKQPSHMSEACKSKIAEEIKK
jgi:hypothetical protein